MKVSIAKSADPPLELQNKAKHGKIHPALQDPIEYRKSGLSLNHIIGCPLDCTYCVRHLFDNFAMKKPTLLMSDNEAVSRLLNHRFFQPGITPLQIFNRATDPFLPSVKPHLFSVLRMLDELQLTNHVLVITRFHVSNEDCEVLNQMLSLRVTLLFTFSGIDDAKIEPIDSNIAAMSLKCAFGNANRYRTVLYWRPIVPGLNDSYRHVQRAIDLSNYAHATVFTGLFYREEIRRFFRDNGIPTCTPMSLDAKSCLKNWTHESLKHSEALHRRARFFERHRVPLRTPTRHMITMGTPVYRNSVTFARQHKYAGAKEHG